MKQIDHIDVIGSQMDMGAVRKGVDMGPLAIRHAGLINRIREVGYQVIDHGDIAPLVAENEGDPRMRFAREINEANKRLYEKVDEAYKSGGFPVVLGGDHSIAAGSVAACAANHRRIGVIWIDAHGDFNDEKITPSGNMHGMPLSALCGCGPDSMVSFTEARVRPENVVIIGARALDPLEKEKLQREKVTVFSISSIHADGMRMVIEQAIQLASNGTDGIYLSFDMDALDPGNAPGVGTPVLNGLSAREAFIACETLFSSEQLLGIDLVETNPLLDNRNMTGTLAVELILTCLGMTEY